MSEHGIERLTIVRHAHAGSQKSFDGPDRERPLTPKGQRQALALARILAPYDIGAIVSSPWLRCHQTMEPLSDMLGIGIEEMAELGVDASEQEGFEALLARAELVGGQIVVGSTHGDNFPLLLARATTEDGAAPPNEIEKAGRIEVTIKSGTTTTVELFSAPAKER